MNVGYFNQTYAEKRLITYVGKQPDVTYVPINRLKDDGIAKILSMVTNEENKAMLNRTMYYYHPFRKPKFDVIHCFNSVANANVPWFSSYESMLPFLLFCDLEKPIPYAWLKHNCELMARDNCKGLYPISKSAYDIEEAYIREHVPEYYDAIMAKTSVLHPPQKLLTSEEKIIQKTEKVKERIEFVFVGTGFWFKGGKEMVEVLEKYKKDYDFKLTIVSDFLKFPHREPGYTQKDYRTSIETIRKNADWITVYNKLSNRQVLKLYEKSHVSLLPSYADSYGYVCLESQAAGCPIVTSDIRAFPEINNDDCGYIFHIDPNLQGKEKQENNRIQLQRIIEEILEHPERIREKALKGVTRIREEHAPEKYAETLKCEYQKAIK